MLPVFPFSSHLLCLQIARSFSPVATRGPRCGLCVIAVWCLLKERFALLESFASPPVWQSSHTMWVSFGSTSCSLAELKESVHCRRAPWPSFWH